MAVQATEMSNEKQLPAPHLPQTHRLPGVDFAEGVSQITGTAISPLLGVSSVGAWRYYKTPTDQRVSLPWFCHPAFWITSFSILAVCLLKDFLGPITPTLLKKPLDMIELFEDKASALVASVAFIPFISSQMAQHFNASPAIALTSNSIHCASALPFASISFDYRFLFIPLGIIAFLLVWITSHAVNVLIAISPFTIIDTLLKLFKMMLLALMTGLYIISPILAAILSIALIILAAFLAPAALRLSIFGTLFATDTLLPWRARRHVTPSAPHSFMMRATTGCATRTYGRIIKSADGSIHFKFRPYWILPARLIPLPADHLSMTRGIYYPSLLHAPDDSNTRVRLVVFLPRYKSHVDAIAQSLLITNIQDSTLQRGFQNAKSWLRETLSYVQNKTAFPRGSQSKS